MCTPALAIATQAAGAASQTVGSWYSAKSQQSSLALQADLADINAQQALLSGQRETQRARLATAGLKSRQRAAMAANGVDLGSGSALNVLTSTDLLGEIDANTIESNAIQAAWGYRTQASQARSQAKAISPFASAASTLIGGAGQVASSWYSFNKAGAFGQAGNIPPESTARMPWAY